MKVVIILAVLLLAANAGGLTLDTERCETEKFDNWDALRVPVRGGSDDYDVIYEKLPQGWYANKDKIYIPKGKIENNKYYSAKVSVYDRRDKQYLKRSVLLNYGSDNKLDKVYDADYEVDYQNRANVDQFLINKFRNNNGFYGSAAQVDSRVVVPNNIVVPSIIVPSNAVVRNDYAQYVAQPLPAQIVTYRPDQAVPAYVNQPRPADDDRRRNPYYDAFPGDDEIDRVTSNADCSRIRDLINFVTQSGFGCKQRAEFLEKFQNKIQIKINIFRTDAEKNKQAIFGLTEQLKAIKDQLNKVNVRGGNIDLVNQRIRGYRSEIERHTRDRSGYENEYRGSKDSIDKLKAEIDGIRQNTFDSKASIEQEQRRIQDIDAKIADLESRLRDLRSDRDQCKERRERHQRTIDDAERRIDDCNSRMRSHQDIIGGFEKKAKYCVDAINDFTKKIEDCNKEIENYGRESERELKVKLVQIQQKIDFSNSEADRLVRLYTEIEKYQSQFEASISKHYYGCYQYAPIKDDAQKDGNRYTAPSSAFINYMKDVFGQAPNENIRARFSGSVSIRKNTIFSPAWTKVYGIPFTAGYGSNKDISENNFSCIESGDKLKVFSGRVEDITKNVIQVVSKTGDRYTVHLGGCTKIESIAEKELPEKGSEIYFKGEERTDKNHYNGYHVTCY